MSAEDVAVRDTPLQERVHQGDCHVLLAGDVGESLRAVLPGKNLIAHRVSQEAADPCRATLIVAFLLPVARLRARVLPRASLSARAE